MRKMIMLIGLSITLLQGCASYKPIIDSKGRSGTFNETRAEEITDDKQHCSTLAKEHVSTISNISYWILSSKMETKYEAYYRQCLKGRGHSVVN
jgi:hypothetical protein